MHSRRDFLSVGLKGLGLISLGSSVPMFVPKLAFAQTEVGSPVAADNVLVIVQLSGGNDGLNTVIPIGADPYIKARPGLAIKEPTIKLDDAYALNPGMASFKSLWDEGKLQIIHGCGYPKPNRSHFESMHIWHTANPEGGTGAGWLGHYIDHLRRGTTASSLGAINIGPELPQALVTDAAPIPSVQNLNDFNVRFDDDSAFDKKLEREILKQLNEIKEGTPAQQFLARQAMNAIVSADEIRSKTQGYKADAQYPNNLGDRLKLIANLISANLGTRVFYCEVGGFDTHNDQFNQHQNLLKNVSDSIAAFMTDLKAKGLDEKVTVMCFSEFGRRVKQNESAGTDHGAAGPMFLVGPKVKPGFKGTHPNLEDLDDGDLKFTTDFRAVYSTLLSKWLACDAGAVLGQTFEPLDLI